MGGPPAKATTAPCTAPTPAKLSSTPNTPAPPYWSRAIAGASAYHCAYMHSTAPANAAIVTHTQARERTSRQPPRSSLRATPARWAPAAAGVRAPASTALNTNVAASNANASPAPTPSTSAVASAGRQEGEVRHPFGQRAGVVVQLLGHRLGDQSGVGGLEERLRGAVTGLDHDDLPNPVARP